MKKNTEFDLVKDSNKTLLRFSLIMSLLLAIIVVGQMIYVRQTDFIQILVCGISIMSLVVFNFTAIISYKRNGFSKYVPIWISIAFYLFFFVLVLCQYLGHKKSNFLCCTSS